jgi:hypothetical protein
MGEEDQPSHPGIPAFATTTPKTKANGMAGIKRGRASIDPRTMIEEAEGLM